MLSEALQNDLDNQFMEYGWLKQLPKNNNDKGQRYRCGLAEISLEPVAGAGVSVVVPLGDVNYQTEFALVAVENELVGYLKIHLDRIKYASSLN